MVNYLGKAQIAIIIAAAFSNSNITVTSGPIIPVSSSYVVDNVNIVTHYIDRK